MNASQKTAILGELDSAVWHQVDQQFQQQNHYHWTSQC